MFVPSIHPFLTDPEKLLTKENNALSGKPHDLLNLVGPFVHRNCLHPQTVPGKLQGRP